MNPDQQMEFADYSYLPPEAGEGAVAGDPGGDGEQAEDGGGAVVGGHRGDALPQGRV